LTSISCLIIPSVCRCSITEKLTKKSEELSDEVEAASSEIKKNRINFTKLGQVVKNIGKDFLRLGQQEARFAMQTATADAGWISGIKQMGIAQIDYMKLLKETRVEGLAATSAGVNFKESLVKSQNSLIGLTSSTTEAAKVSGMFHKNMARIGVSQDDLGDAVLQQTKIYKENYRALGYTAEEFANLTSELINDQGMRDVLLTLQEKERKAYVLGIQQRMAEYQTMGYTIDRAKELQKTFQNLVGMDPKERMKQAAKKRAMMGAMGMGAEGAELMDLEIRYRTMTADQKKDADIRMAEIQQQGAKVFGEMSGAGSSLGQSMAMQMMAQKTGFDKVAQTFEVESGAGLKIDKEQLGVLHEISEFIKNAVTGLDIWGALTNSALGSIVPNLLKGLGGLLTLYLGKKFLGRLIGGGKGGGGKGTFSKVKGDVKSGRYADARFTKVQAGVHTPRAGEIPRPVAPKGAKSAAGAVSKSLGKSTFKSALKKIPIFGALAGIGFGIGRLLDGDVLGAAGEVASGVASILPGAGTAASIGIDAALAARDIAKAKADIKGSTGQGTEKPKELRSKSEMSSVTQSSHQQSELLSTLQELQKYIKDINMQNMEQATAVSKLADALMLDNRFNSVSDR